MKQLLTNPACLGAAALMLLAGTATVRADYGNEPGRHYIDRNNPPSESSGSGWYRAHELSLDLFGSASLSEHTIDHLSGTRVRENTRLGAGAGINYFFTQNLGLGGDVYSENTTGAFIDSASASMYLRFPLGNSGFAPYVYGGGGRQFDTLKNWFAQAGGGIEYRFNPHMGMFIDARGVLPDEARYYGVARLGMRFAF